MEDRRFAPRIGEIEDDESSRMDLASSMSPPMVETPLSFTTEASSPSVFSPESSTSSQKLKAGRPRKATLLAPPTPPSAAALDAQSKVAKGRSKTGCVTCRRRKKKCDETKPHCLNCQKNAVVCEGYPERVVWKSGKQKAEEARAARAGTGPKELSSLVDGVDTDLDQHFLHHFTSNVSRVLTIEGEAGNPFLGMLMPMALRHKGLMHALLCLAASHIKDINHEEPVFERQLFHFEEACKELRGERRTREDHWYVAELVDDPTVASTLVLCLNSICKGDSHGEYRPHLDAAKALVMHQHTRNAAFSEFLVEFFHYHDTLNNITSMDRRSYSFFDEFMLPGFIVQPGVGTMLGIMDGLFGYYSCITRLRDEIRRRISLRLKPTLDWRIITHAVDIDRSIRFWTPSPFEEDGSARKIATLLYRQCAWIYLYRSIQPSRGSLKLKAAVDEGLAILEQLHPDATTQSILLMPVFILGCAAFEHSQRPDIRKAFGTLKRYASLGNIEPARQVVDRVWYRMDHNDEGSWDWETIISDLGYDFLAT